MRHAILPVMILALGTLAAWFMPMKRPASEVEPPSTAAPIVSVIEAQPQDLALSVIAHGIVTSRTEIDLVAEVRGKLIYAAPAFVAGGFFAKDDLLLSIDPRDYELAVIRAEAAVAEARQNLKREQAEADLAAEEWQMLGGGRDASPLVLRLPQMAEAMAKMSSAEADFALARLELERTNIRAPFDGRVRAKDADVGTYVTPGEKLAKVYATDVAEIRLPLDDRDLRYLDLSLGRENDRNTIEQPGVEINVDFAGEHHHWSGCIVRTEGVIDPESRLIYAVAQVTDPYSPEQRSSKPPLAPGMFVAATIKGNVLKQVYPLPSDALHRPDEVLVVDDEDVLRTRSITVLKDEPDRIIASNGLRPGDRVAINLPANAFPGTIVRVQQSEEDEPPSVAKAEPR